MAPLLGLKAADDMAPTSVIPMVTPSPPSVYLNGMVCYQYPADGQAYPLHPPPAAIPPPGSLQRHPGTGTVTVPAVPVPVPVSQPVPVTCSAPQREQHLPTTPMTTVAMSRGAMTPVYVDAPPQPLRISVTQQMELIWHGEFDRLFSMFESYWCTKWHLMPTMTPPTGTQLYLLPSNLYMPSMQWNAFLDSAKVRFCCENCGHGWTSMKGRVSFWISLDLAASVGYVLFKLYGQQCKRCENGLFDHAMWYPEEVTKVIGNVYNCVGQLFYGFSQPPLRIERRSGKPKEQHNSSLCQACQDGVCKAEVRYRPT